MINPMLAPVRALLQEAARLPITEHQLLAVLVEQNVLDATYARESLSLFQAHFLVMNALYSIRNENREEGRELQVDPLAIDWLLTECNPSIKDRGLPAQTDPLAEYYLDWTHFRQASTESVDQLLDDFWSRYLSFDQADQALEVLGLSPPVDWSEIKSRYRQLVMETHPDRGGDADEFARVRDAYETLKRAMGSD